MEIISTINMFFAVYIVFFLISYPLIVDKTSIHAISSILFGLRLRLSSLHQVLICFGMDYLIWNCRYSERFYFTNGIPFYGISTAILLIMITTLSLKIN